MSFWWDACTELCGPASKSASPGKRLVFARLSEPHFPKYTCLLLSDQPTFQGKVPKGKKQEQELKLGVGGEASQLSLPEWLSR